MRFEYFVHCPSFFLLIHFSGNLPKDLKNYGTFLITFTKLVLASIGLFATPWTVAYQASPSMGFSRQECWSHFLLQGIFLTQESNVGLLNYRQILYNLKQQESPNIPQFPGEVTLKKSVNLICKWLQTNSGSVVQGTSPVCGFTSLSNS